VEEREEGQGLTALKRPAVSGRNLFLPAYRFKTASVLILLIPFRRSFFLSQ
jgi:hypothetical protein